MANKLISVIVRGNPVSKGRPRFGLGRTFTPQSTIDGEQAIQWAIKQQCPGILVDEKSMFALYVYFYMKTARRNDIDNLIKLVMDAMNGMVYKDDSQVVEITARVVRGNSSPRTELFVIALD